MKTIYTTFLFALTSLYVHSQCPMTVNIFNPFSPTCNGGCNGSAYAMASNGTPPYSYIWLPGGQTTQLATGLCAGTYTVSVTDATPCPAVTAAVTLPQPPAISITISSTPASCSTCPDGTATANPTNGNPPYTYLWSPGGQSTQTATGLLPGTYTVCVTDVQGCTQCDIVTVTYAIGINEISSSDIISIYPNPSRGEFQIQLVAPWRQQLASSQKQGASIEIYNVYGEKVYSSFIISHSSLINLNAPSGIYFLQLKSENGTVNKKIVITR